MIFGFFLTVAQPVTDVLNPRSKVIWLGLDFTAAKLIGDRSKWGPSFRTQRILESLNELIVREYPKYDIADALNIRRVENEIQITREHNRRLNLENAVCDRLNGHFLNLDDVRQIVSLYDFKGMTGTGVMFVVEAFNKPDLKSVVWVTFVNLETREVLLSEKLVDEPAGFGLRNFWAGSIYKILKQIKRRDYDVWRRQYSREK